MYAREGARLINMSLLCIVIPRFFDYKSGFRVSQKPPASCGCMCVLLGPQTQIHSASHSVFPQQNLLLYRGPPLQTVYERIRGSLTTPSNALPAWPPRLWPLHTPTMRGTWKEGIHAAFPRAKFDHTPGKNECIIREWTKTRGEECCASLLRELSCVFAFIEPASAIIMIQGQIRARTREVKSMK